GEPRRILSPLRLPVPPSRPEKKYRCWRSLGAVPVSHSFRMRANWLEHQRDERLLYTLRSRMIRRVAGFNTTTLPCSSAQARAPWEKRNAICLEPFKRRHTPPVLESTSYRKTSTPLSRHTGIAIQRSCKAAWCRFPGIVSVFTLSRAP